MKMKHLAASLLIAFSGAATAVPTYLGVLDDASAEFEHAWVRYFDYGSAVGPFVDSYTFDLNGAANTVGTIFKFDFGSLELALNNISLYLTADPGTVLIDNSPAEFSFTNLGAGSYTLDVAGSVADNGNFYLGGAYYQGKITSFASPAPEPETLAMMLAGLVAVGSLVARRRKH